LVRLPAEGRVRSKLFKRARTGEAEKLSYVIPLQCYRQEQGIRGHDGSVEHGVLAIFSVLSLTYGKLDAIAGLGDPGVVMLAAVIAVPDLVKKHPK
jgi:hypothetical protein